MNEEERKRFFEIKVEKDYDKLLSHYEKPEVGSIVLDALFYVGALQTLRSEYSEPNRELAVHFKKKLDEPPVKLPYYLMKSLNDHYNEWYDLLNVKVHDFIS
jgi:hypothetical protein